MFRMMHPRVSCLLGMKRIYMGMHETPNSEQRALRKHNFYINLKKIKGKERIMKWREEDETKKKAKTTKEKWRKENSLLQQKEKEI